MTRGAGSGCEDKGGCYEAQQSSRNELRLRLPPPDFYFPDQRVVVHSDSGIYHRGGRGKIKDAEVSGRAKAMGTTPVRVSGRTIIYALNTALAEVLAHMP